MTSHGPLDWPTREDDGHGTAAASRPKADRVRGGWMAFGGAGWQTALLEECCIRKAVNERGLNSGPVGLADAISEDEAATGTAFALARFTFGLLARIIS